MNVTRTWQRKHREDGFVLVTSLIFLVVVTLLAVSAINSSTLQERMASNLREKSRARQAADAALRQGELILRDTAFDELPPPKSTVTLDGKYPGNSPDGSLALKTIVPPEDSEGPGTFLNADIWSEGAPSATYTADARMPAVQYYVELVGCAPRNLSLDARARCEGTALYRITARAEGQNPAAVAVEQSFFGRRY